MLNQVLINPKQSRNLVPKAPNVLRGLSVPQEDADYRVVTNEAKKQRG
jgi:hypothetical protein